MIGEALIVQARKAANSVLREVLWQVVWSAVGAVLILAALLVGAVALYWWLEGHLGAIAAAASMAGILFALGALCLALARWSARREQGPAAKPVSTADQIPKGEPDYFASLKLVTPAFLFGLGLARRLRR